EIGDRITSVNGLFVRTKEDIINELRRFRVGDVVAFEYDRDGTTRVIDVVLGERPEDP
ncbi:MAG: PDZ domain-containing protein, partial [Actinobacteria bacterium]|nr:PDZ domain-containing protein [Actinomycetota bacterium]NIV56561.1 PDZ domain-containing protein [Actinomycetota bacterium]